MAENKIRQPFVTGKKMEIEMVTVAKVRDGKLVEETLYFDNLRVMKQLGLV